MYEEERTLIIQSCRQMQRKEYFLGTWGNISMRLGDHILLTPSRVDYNLMRPEDIVVIGLDGMVISGNKNPTSEKEVHRQIYLIREDIKAIIHAHTPKAMAVSSLSIQEIPCLVEEMSQLIGGSIPLTKDYVPAKEHVKLGLEAAAAIGEKNGVILRNHGPVACGRNMDEAILTTQVLEKAAAIYLDIKDKGWCRQIPKRDAESERYRFLYTYGKEKT